MRAGTCPLTGVLVSFRPLSFSKVARWWTGFLEQVNGHLQGCLHVTHARNLDHDVRELNMNSSVSCSCLLSSYFNFLFIYIYIPVTSLLMFGDIFLCSVFCALCFVLFVKLSVFENRKQKHRQHSLIGLCSIQKVYS